MYWSYLGCPFNSKYILLSKTGSFNTFFVYVALWYCPIFPFALCAIKKTGFCDLILSVLWEYVPISKLNHVKYGHIFQDIFEVGRADIPAQCCHSTWKVVFLDIAFWLFTNEFSFLSNFGQGLEHLTIALFVT